MFRNVQVQSQPHMARQQFQHTIKPLPIKKDDSPIDGYFIQRLQKIMDTTVPQTS